MVQDEGRSEFQEGLTGLWAGRWRAAIRHLRRSVTLDEQNPLYLSYLGLAMGVALENWEEAEKLCFTAVLMKRDQPELYLNIAEIYRRAGKSQDARWILKCGLEFTNHDARLQHALSRLGVRRPPVLPFLDRKNLLNRELGRLRSRLSDRRVNSL